MSTNLQYIIKPSLDKTLTRSGIFDSDWSVTTLSCQMFYVHVFI